MAVSLESNVPGSILMPLTGNTHDAESKSILGGSARAEKLECFDIQTLGCSYCALSTRKQREGGSRGTKLSY